MRSYVDQEFEGHHEWPCVSVDTKQLLVWDTAFDKGSMALTEGLRVEYSIPVLCQTVTAIDTRQRDDRTSVCEIDIGKL